MPRDTRSRPPARRQRGIQATISRVNVYNVGTMVEQTVAQGVAPVFRQATVIDRLGNRASMLEVGLEPAERSFLADLLTSAGLKAVTKNPARRLFYRDLSRRLISGASRRAPCYYQREGVLLSPQGELSHCSISTEPIGNVRRQSATICTFRPPPRRRASAS